MKKLIWSRILLGVGIALLVCYIGGIIYFYNFHAYNPYASAGAPEIDTLISSVLLLPPTIVCLLTSLVLRIMHKKSKK